jgi:uncharacterized protein YbjT (DUF2867 family)
VPPPPTSAPLEPSPATVDGRVLVFGATGTHGGAVARALLGAGRSITAFVRDPRSTRAQALERAGAQVVVGDLEDPASVSRGLEGIQTAYAVTTPFEGGPAAEVRQGEQIIAAATQVQLPWLILASVASATDADVPHFKSKARIEERLRQSTLTWTVVAPSYFYENVLSLASAISEGRLPLALPPAQPLQQVALADLGAVVAAILARPAEHAGQRIEVAADDPTPEQMAEAIGVRHEQIPAAQIQARSPDLAAMYAFLASGGYTVDIPALKQRYPEIRWKSFSEWAGARDWHPAHPAAPS